MERDYIRLDYWTSDCSLVVDFVFWDRGARGWRIYIISQIDYQGRNCSYQETLAKKYPFSKDELNERNKELFPANVLARKTLVVFGTGGSIGFVLDMARSGVTNFILVDGDKFEPHNMSNQRVTYSDIGKSKVEVLREQILNINMDAEVKTFCDFLDDTVTDKDFEEMLGDRLLVSPKDILICACTDSFEAQARLAALAMKYGTPFMAPQIYAGGVGAEVVFSYSGVTPSCPSCVLKSRYDAYKNGYKNTVTSKSTPISAITHANALEGQIALMLLLYHEGDSRYTTMLLIATWRYSRCLRMPRKCLVSICSTMQWMILTPFSVK